VAVVADLPILSTGIPNDRDYRPLNFRQNMYLVLPVSTFIAIHLAGYNISLPSQTEQMIWRVNSIAMALSLHVHCVSEAVGCWLTDYQVESLELFGGYKKQLPGCLIFIGLAWVYSVSRILLLVEAVISLRSMPATAFVEVSWLQFLPRV
jgi:hypothetical protein